MTLTLVVLIYLTVVLLVFFLVAGWIIRRLYIERGNLRTLQQWCTSHNHWHVAHSDGYGEDDPPPLE